MDRALVATHPLELAVKAENPSANTNHSLQRQGVVADRIEQAGNLSFSKRKSQCNFFLFYASNRWIHSYHDKATCMTINESSWDSVLRIFSGLFLLYVGLAGELIGASAILADLFGLFLLLTGVIGFCPVYTLFRRKK